MSWVSESLTPAHQVDGFDCGVESLNRWLKTHASLASAAGTAATYVWVGPDSQTVMAYYAIAPTVVASAEVSKSMAAGSSSDIPAYLLAKLALDTRLHGQGLGGELLIDALETMVRASERAGGRLLVVDALDSDVAAFYRRYDFQPVKGTPNRLVMKAATARNTLGLGSLSIAASADAGLVSMVLNRPDGTVTPFVGDSDEVRRVAAAMIAAAEEQERTGGRIDLKLVMTQALGRDPFAES